ncbi:MAG: AAA family ATPase [Alphaproteobacteria bacterium]|nr:AAA family ATPase [Alphaproteobacteria bacterium]
MTATAQSEIYADFYGLNGRPFHVTADPRSLFLSDGHKEALAAIIHGVRSGKGFVVVTGEVGIGKTTVLRAALDQLSGDKLKLIYILYPQITVEELFRQISEALGEPVTGAVDVAHLMELLIAQYRQGISVVVVIDEAQRLAVEVLESLRLLSNFETEDDKLVQTVLLGQPELEDMLARHDMRQFRSRVAFWVRIKALSWRDSHLYVAHRLRAVGGEPRELFSSAAIDYIVREARGFPRSLNIYCDNALITGFGYQAKPVTWSIAREALAGFRGDHGSWLRRPLLFGTSVVGGVAATAMAGLTMMPQRDEPLAADTRAPGLAASAISAALPSDGAPPVAPAVTPVPPMAAAAAAPQASAAPSAYNVGSTMPAPRRTAPPAETRIIVRNGDTLQTLTTRVYGRSSHEIIAKVARYNRDLHDPNHLEAGEELVFPSLNAATGTDSGAPNASRTHRSSQ